MVVQCNDILTKHRYNLELHLSRTLVAYKNRDIL